MVPAYVEVYVALASDSGVAAWSYEPELWGGADRGRTRRPHWPHWPR
jgi:hypothetical protein